MTYEVRPVLSLWTKYVVTKGQAYTLRWLRGKPQNVSIEEHTICRIEYPNFLAGLIGRFGSVFVKTRSSETAFRNIFDPNKFYDAVIEERDRPAREKAQTEYQASAPLSDTIIQIPEIPSFIDNTMWSALPISCRADQSSFKKLQAGDWVNKDDVIDITNFFKLISPVSGRVISTCATIQGDFNPPSIDPYAIERFAISILPEAHEVTSIRWLSCLDYDSRLIKRTLKEIKKTRFIQHKGDISANFYKCLDFIETSRIPTIPVKDFVSSDYVDVRT